MVTVIFQSFVFFPLSDTIASIVTINWTTTIMGIFLVNQNVICSKTNFPFVTLWSNRTYYCCNSSLKFINLQTDLLLTLLFALPSLFIVTGKKFECSSFTCCES
jgi:hypothetical protein